jgi:peroxiredoxin
MVAVELKVWDPAPDFNALDEAGRPFSLRTSTRKGPAVVLFFPSVWGMMCNVELETFRDMTSDFERSEGQLEALCTNGVMSISHYKKNSSGYLSS